MSTYVAETLSARLRAGLSVSALQAKPALEVFGDIDRSDLCEVELTHGRPIVAAEELLEIFKTAEKAHALCLIAWRHSPQGGAVPFAILGLGCFTECVATAALLARDHRAWKRPLAHLVLELRRELPRFMFEMSLRRLEARSWPDHPTAASLLSGIGFEREASLPGCACDGGPFDLYGFVPQRPGG
ncbi:MAG: hypothetical protein AAF899_06755 [Pseudomonadota bacterium]